jgi:L-threonylcarbamoyladenylate synthase
MVVVVDAKISSEIFAYPTDTVWGMGGNIYSSEVVAAIRQVKGVNDSKPHSILFDSSKEIVQFFSLPAALSITLLERVLSLESTVGIPLEWARKEIPYEITAGSSWVAVRLLDTSPVREVVSKAMGPVITTSLNRTGEDPICSAKKAKEFISTSPRPITLVDDGQDYCSGHSSSIVLLRVGGGYSLVRNGRFAEQIVHLLEEIAF